jgi:hypothetical protein
MTTNIDKITGALADFNRVEAGLAALTEQYAGVVYDVTTTEGIEAARLARRTIREPRYEVEKVRKDAKAPLLALGRQIDDEAKRITAALLAIETPIDQQITAEEARREAERQAKIRAEQQRVEKIRARIEQIRGMATTAAAFSTDKISRRISELAQVSIDDSFAEFKDEAGRVLTETATTLQDLHAAAQEREAEQARLAAERAELEQLRAAQAKRDAEERRKLDAERAELARQRAAAVVTSAPGTDKTDITPVPSVSSVAPLARPTARDILDVLEAHYKAPRTTIIGWLREAFGTERAA